VLPVSLQRRVDREELQPGVHVPAQAAQAFHPGADAGELLDASPEASELGADFGPLYVGVGRRAAVALGDGVPESLL
jgi:hypothetical protein